MKATLLDPLLIGYSLVQSKGEGDNSSLAGRRVSFRDETLL